LFCFAENLLFFGRAGFLRVSIEPCKDRMADVQKPNVLLYLPECRYILQVSVYNYYILLLLQEETLK